MSGFDTSLFLVTAEKIYLKAKEEGRLLENPAEPELRKMVEKEPGVRMTKYGSFVAESEPTSRSTMFTRNSLDSAFGAEELRLLAQCEEAMGKERLISLDRLVGNYQSNTVVRLIVPERFAHVAYGGGNLFIPPVKKVDSPDYNILFFADEAFEKNRDKPLPQKDITIRLAMLPDGRYVKIIRNGNYIGEYKKGVFAAEDWVAK